MGKLPEELALLHKTYIRGLGEMKLPVPSYPDANFTIRLTYGNVKPYSPKDGVYYKYYTTTDGILEKENPEDREFVVPAKLKELIEKKISDAMHCPMVKCRFVSCLPMTSQAVTPEVRY